MLHFTSKNNDTAPLFTLNDTALEVVDSYKYLGIEVNTGLDPSQQWERVYSLISSTPFLIRQLKRNGLNEAILIKIYKSLALSHFNYSATILDTTTQATKRNMAVYQNKILCIIDISKPDALKKYELMEITSYIKSCSTKQVKKLLTDRTNPLTQSLVTKAKRRNHAAFELDIPTARTTKFDQSPVLTTLRIMEEEFRNEEERESKASKAICSANS